MTFDPPGERKTSSRRRARFASRPMLIVFGLQLALLWVVLRLSGLSLQVLGIWFVLSRLTTGAIPWHAHNPSLHADRTHAREPAGGEGTI